ncbi:MULTISPECIES: integrase core domain-containing protein [Synechococcales]|uniref:integrase core domain-containing protein n=1 Tax=Synechococcus sp. CS-1324 TaxID=2847980 RepID=UPI0037D99416
MQPCLSGHSSGPALQGCGCDRYDRGAAKAVSSTYPSEDGNGPEFIAHALQEWCTGSGSATAYIPPGSPWGNPFVESFNGRLRDEFL